jgi:hypothetical protein
MAIVPRLSLDAAGGYVATTGFVEEPRRRPACRATAPLGLERVMSGDDIVGVGFSSALPAILARAGRLHAAQAADGDQISPGDVNVDWILPLQDIPAALERLVGGPVG